MAEMSPSEKLAAVKARSKHPISNNFFETFDFDLDGKNVKIANESPSLGDFISWVPYIDQFQKKYNCNLDFYTPNTDLFKESYNNINFFFLFFTSNKHPINR